MKYKLIILFIIVITVAGFYFVADWVKITKIDITGNEHNTEDEILEIVGFQRELSVLDTIKHRPTQIENVGYIAKIEISYPTITTIKINVIEKERMGYVKYMSTFLCVDSNAYIIDSVKVPDDKVARIEGLNVKSFTLNEALDIDDEIKLTIMNIYNLLKSYGLTADVINLNYKQADNITVEIGDIKIHLGKGERLEEKLGLARDILSGMQTGKKGSLHLENPDKTIIFKNDGVEQNLEAEQASGQEEDQKKQ